MKRKPKAPVVPKLPAHFTENLAKVAKGLHQKPIHTNFVKKWSISEEEASALLQYLFDTGMITMKWLPEHRTLCFLEKELLN